MLTAKRAFGGEDVSETLASILKLNPDWSALPSGLPTRLRELLERCLEKDSRIRWRDIGDVRVELEWILTDPDDTSIRVESPRAAARPGLSWICIAGAAVLMAVSFASASGIFAPTPPAFSHIHQPLDIAGSLCRITH